MRLSSEALKLVSYVILTLFRLQVHTVLFWRPYHASSVAVFRHIEQFLGIVLFSMSELMSDVSYEHVLMFLEEVFVETFSERPW